MPPQRQIRSYYNTPYPTFEQTAESQSSQNVFPSQPDRNDSDDISDSTQPTVNSDQEANRPSATSFQITIPELPRMGGSQSLERSTSKRKLQIPHPYARLLSENDEVKRRKAWPHVLEKDIFSPYEISTMGAPKRREIYISSLEAYIDRLHAQLMRLGFWPVEVSELDRFQGLNSKIAKSMVAGLQYDAFMSDVKLSEMKQANKKLEKTFETITQTDSDDERNAQ